MTGEATSPVTGPGTVSAVARWTPAEWRTFAAFLRRPALPTRVTGLRPAALGATLRLFALDLVLMALLIGLAALATAFGFRFPENAIDQLNLSPMWLGIIVVGAPLAEELAFRGWLSGRPGHVTALIALLVGIAIPIVSGPQAHPILVLGSMAIAVIVAIGLLFWLRKRPPFRFFSRHFAWFYAASALLFASAHLANYTVDASPILLLLVVPQLIAGLIFGYARVTYGLWSDMLLHMLHNGLLISLVVLEKGMAG
jgi:membrane protease YdiL (CAAX protease family)